MVILKFTSKLEFIDLVLELDKYCDHGTGFDIRSDDLRKLIFYNSMIGIHVKLSIKDLDYRKSKYNKTKIIETKKGFSTLKIYLNKWINSKIQELNDVSIEKK